MNYYFDIIIKPDFKNRSNVLLNAIYTKLHKALWDLASTNIGVSFPKYKITLGNILRVHGEEATLHNLLNLGWIDNQQTHEISRIQPVPIDSKFRIVSRKQPTMSKSKMNRIIKRGSLTEEALKDYKEKMFSKGLSHPYLELVSNSNGQKHRRYIQFGELMETPIPGMFDQFGLSKEATVPWFD